MADTVDTLSADNTATAAMPDYLASPDAVFKDKGVQWRHGKPPDYSNTRAYWRKYKQANHAAGSLPEMVENLVKNWEVEASFKPRLSDWRTIDHANYTFAMNGATPQTAEHMLAVGTYNAIIAEPNQYYSPANSDFEASHKTFKRMMPTFAWEVMEVYSGPPTVAFRWRHFGTMVNDYVAINDKREKVTIEAHGGLIEIFGVTVAKVDDKIRIQSVETWMDPMALFKQIARDGILGKGDVVTTIPKNGSGGDNVTNTTDDHNNGYVVSSSATHDTKHSATQAQAQSSACPFVASTIAGHTITPQQDDGHVGTTVEVFTHQAKHSISAEPEPLPAATIKAHTSPLPKPQSRTPKHGRHGSKDERVPKSGTKKAASCPADESGRSNGTKKPKLQLETDTSAVQLSDGKSANGKESNID